MEPLVAIIIPSWNARRAIGDAALDDCLTAAAAQLDVTTRVILVDNGSDDGTADWVRARHPEVIVVHLPRNLGFAGGVNAGIRAALDEPVDSVALLNNDAVPDSTWLCSLHAALADPAVGIVACKLVRADGRLDSTGDSLTTWGLPLPRGRDEVDRGQYDALPMRRILSASGGATLYRREVLEQVGLFDEHFFAYYEDVDLALRARLVGWEVRYEPGARTVHRVNSTSATVPGLVEMHSLKNLLLLWMKDLPAAVLLRFAPKLAAMLFFRLLLTTRAAGPRVVLRSLGLTARATPSALRARRRIQRSRTLPVSELISLLDHEWRPRALGGFRAVQGGAPPEAPGATP